MNIHAHHMSRATADHLTRQLTALGNKSASLRARGVCTHGWLQGHRGGYGPAMCLHCGAVFQDTDEAWRIGRALLRG